MIEGARWRKWVFFYVPMTLFLLFLLFPFYWMVITSVRPDGELYRPWNSINYNPFWTWKPTWDHVRYLFEETLFASWLWNTMFIALVSTAIEQGPYMDAPGTRFADIERPHTLRAVKLMPRERHEIHVQVIDIAGDFPCALHRITVEPYPMLVGHGTNGRQWPNGADFTIHVHH